MCKFKCSLTLFFRSESVESAEFSFQIGLSCNMEPMKKQIFCYEFGTTFERIYELDAIKGSTTFVMEPIGFSLLLIVGNTGCVLFKLE